MTTSKIIAMTLFVAAALFAWLCFSGEAGQSGKKNVLAILDHGDSKTALAGVEIGFNRGQVRMLKDKATTNYLSAALKADRSWPSEDQLVGDSFSLNLCFHLDDGSTYYPDASRYYETGWLMLSVGGSDGWPTHYVYLPNPVPNNLSDALPANKL